MIKKLLSFAIFLLFYTTTVFANPSVYFQLSKDGVADITVTGVQENIKSLQLDFEVLNDVSINKFQPSKDFKYSKFIEKKNGDKTNYSILLDESFNIFSSNSLSLGSIFFQEMPTISESVKLELANIDIGLIGKKLDLIARIEIVDTNNNGNDNYEESSTEATTSSLTTTTTIISTEKNTETTTDKQEETNKDEKPNNEEIYPVIKNVEFKDISNHWAKKSISYLAERGIINGISEGEFAPNSNITRAEFVTLLARLDKIDEAKFKINGLKDVPENAWFNPYVAWAIENGITSGIDKNTFAPKDNITREQMAVMIKRFSDYKNISLKEINAKKIFLDESNISSYAKEAVEIIQKAGIINGRLDGTFAPKAKATRAEASEIIYKLLESQ